MTDNWDDSDDDWDADDDDRCLTELSRTDPFSAFIEASWSFLRGPPTERRSHALHYSDEEMPPLGKKPTAAIPKKSARKSKKDATESVRQAAKDFQSNLASRSVAGALFPVGIDPFKIKLEGPATKKLEKEAWVKSMKLVSDHFAKTCGLEVDYNHSPHFFPVNYKCSEEELAVKREKIQNAKRSLGQATRRRLNRI